MAGFDFAGFDSAGFDTDPVAALQPTGGWWRNPRADANKRLREEIERERKAAEISKQASAVIAEVAEQQLGLAQTELQRTEQLVEALRTARIAWKQKYDKALTVYREAYRRAESDAEDELLLM